MTISTAGLLDAKLNPMPFRTANPGISRHDGTALKPVVTITATTRPTDRHARGGITMPQPQVAETRISPPVVPTPQPLKADAIPIQIWEGTVIEVYQADETMQVELNAKLGQIPRHMAEIDLQWVADQDRELLHPGAVFYLTLFKRTRRGSIENAQKLRFRRRPSWSAIQIEKIHEDAAMLLSKMKVPSTSE